MRLRLNELISKLSEELLTFSAVSSIGDTADELQAVFRQLEIDELDELNQLKGVFRFVELIEEDMAVIRNESKALAEYLGIYVLTNDEMYQFMINNMISCLNEEKIDEAKFYCKNLFSSVVVGIVSKRFLEYNSIFDSIYHDYIQLKSSMFSWGYKLKQFIK